MKYRVSRISVVQSSKIAAMLYVLMGGIYAVIGIPMILFGEGSAVTTGIFFLLMPIIMGVFGFAACAFMLWVYNMLAKIVGGMEFELTEAGE